MKKFIFMALFGSSLFADSSLGIVINGSNGNNQFNSPRNYQQEYPNFNYNRDSYYNEDGLYFGFFNNKGYYINDVILNIEIDMVIMIDCIEEVILDHI